MVLGLLILTLVAANVGGVLSLVLQFGRGEWIAGLGTLLFLALLDVMGFWLLRGLREDR